jgi:cardiolipin synthase
MSNGHDQVPSAPPASAPAIVRRTAETALAIRYVEEPRTLVPGNSVRLLRNGEEAFPAWIAAVDAARVRVSMEMYIFNDDRIGQRVGDALARAARRGLEVRLLYDFVGCRSASPEFFKRLREAGVHTIAYHRYHFWRPRFWALFRRNHRKTLVCDGEVAFTGGINISDEWLPTAEGGGGWHDAAVELRGPAVAQIEAIFLATWNRRAKRRARLRPDRIARPAAAGDTPVVVVGNSELKERFAIRRAALHAIRESRERVYLANPYFVPDRGILRALRRAAERGVDVRVLVPAASDTRTLDYAARATFPGLLASGVRIFQHQAVVHTKALLVDRHFVSIGSYNLDHRSLAYNLELVVNTVDAAHAEAVAQMLAADMNTADEIHREAFSRRSALQRLLERLAYSLRHWL